MASARSDAVSSPNRTPSHVPAFAAASANCRLFSLREAPLPVFPVGDVKTRPRQQAASRKQIAVPRALPAIEPTHPETAHAIPI